jgi:hypothetical protein
MITLPEVLAVMSSDCRIGTPDESSVESCARETRDGDLAKDIAEKRDLEQDTVDVFTTAGRLVVKLHGNSSADD